MWKCGDVLPRRMQPPTTKHGWKQVMKGEETIPKTKERDMENVEAWGCYDREETKEYQRQVRGTRRM